MRLAVTGITGGVGLRLCEMALAGGHAVAGLCRDPSSKAARGLAGKGVRLVTGDLDNSRALLDLARSADAFLHTAAHVGDAGTPEQFDRVNVGGTLHAVEAAAGAEVPR